MKEKNIKNMLSLPTIEAFVGNTPLVKLQRIPKNLVMSYWVNLRVIILQDQ